MDREDPSITNTNDTSEMLVNPDNLSNYYSHIALNMRLIDGFIHKSNNI